MVIKITTIMVLLMILLEAFLVLLKIGFLLLKTIVEVLILICGLLIKLTLAMLLFVVVSSIILNLIGVSIDCDYQGCSVKFGNKKY